MSQANGNPLMGQGVRQLVYLLTDIIGSNKPSTDSLYKSPTVVTVHESCRLLLKLRWIFEALYITFCDGSTHPDIKTLHAGGILQVLILITEHFSSDEIQSHLSVDQNWHVWRYLALDAITTGTRLLTLLGNDVEVSDHDIVLVKLREMYDMWVEMEEKNSLPDLEVDTRIMERVILRSMKLHIAVRKLRIPWEEELQTQTNAINTSPGASPETFWRLHDIVSEACLWQLASAEGIMKAGSKGDLKIAAVYWNIRHSCADMRSSKLATAIIYYQMRRLSMLLGIKDETLITREQYSMMSEMLEKRSAKDQVKFNYPSTVLDEEFGARALDQSPLRFSQPSDLDKQHKPLSSLPYPDDLNTSLEIRPMAYANKDGCLRPVHGDEFQNPTYQASHPTYRQNGECNQSGSNYSKRKAVDEVLDLESPRTTSSASTLQPARASHPTQAQATIHTSSSTKASQFSQEERTVTENKSMSAEFWTRTAPCSLEPIPSNDDFKEVLSPPCDHNRNDSQSSGLQSLRPSNHSQATEPNASELDDARNRASSPPSSIASKKSNIISRIFGSSTKPPKPATKQRLADLRFCFSTCGSYIVFWRLGVTSKVVRITSPFSSGRPIFLVKSANNAIGELEQRVDSGNIRHLACCSSLVQNSVVALVDVNNGTYIYGIKENELRRLKTLEKQIPVVHSLALSSDGEVIAIGCGREILEYRSRDASGLTGPERLVTKVEKGNVCNHKLSFAPGTHILSSAVQANHEQESVKVHISIWACTGTTSQCMYDLGTLTVPLEAPGDKITSVYYTGDGIFLAAAISAKHPSIFHILSTEEGSKRISSRYLRVLDSDNYSVVGCAQASSPGRSHIFAARLMDGNRLCRVNVNAETRSIELVDKLQNDGVYFREDCIALGIQSAASEENTIAETIHVIWRTPQEQLILKSYVRRKDGKWSLPAGNQKDLSGLYHNYDSFTYEKWTMLTYG